MDRKYFIIVILLAAYQTLSTSAFKSEKKLQTENARAKRSLRVAIEQKPNTYLLDYPTDEEEDKEVHERVKRSPWGSGGSRSGSRGGRRGGGSRSSSSGRRGGGWGGGRRSSSSSGRRSGGWGGGRRTSSSSRGGGWGGRRTSSRTPSGRRGSIWGGRRTTSVRTAPKKTAPKKSGGWWGGSKKTKSTTSKVLDKVQTGLDGLGMLPGVGIVPDALNAGIHAVRGNKLGVATSLGAMVPVAGQAVTGAKYAGKAVTALKTATQAEKLAAKAKTVKSYKINKKKNIETLKESSANYRQAKKAFKKSVDPNTVKSPKKGVRIGQTPDKKTVTLRDGKLEKDPAKAKSKGSGKHGPTLEIRDVNGDNTKVRVSGTGRG